MMNRYENERLAGELVSLLCGAFPGITVAVEYSRRWSRDCVTFCWPGFSDLLPEERFHRVVGVIPEEFRTTHMAGLVWLELAPGETVEEYLKLPRSEDVANEDELWLALERVEFFRLLGEALGSSPEARCAGDFGLTVSVLSTCNLSPAQIRDAKLLFIRHGVFCDCQVIPIARPALTRSGVEAV
jgi:hypothetical protein